MAINYQISDQSSDKDAEVHPHSSGGIECLDTMGICKVENSWRRGFCHGRQDGPDQ